MTDLIAQINRAASEAKPESKLFIGFWSSKAFATKANKTKILNVDYLGDDNGYDDRDGMALDSLAIGQAWTSTVSGISHTITRVR